MKEYQRTICIEIGKPSSYLYFKIEKGCYQVTRNDDMLSGGCDGQDPHEGYI